MSVACRRPVPAMTEQLAHQRQVFTCHDGLTGRRMSQVVQAQPAQPGIGARRPPTSRENPDTPAFRVSRKQERVGIAGAGQRLDERPCGLAERHGTRTGLRIAKNLDPSNLLKYNNYYLF